MNNQFVTYDIAVKLRELGFMDKCLACYPYLQGLVFAEMDNSNDAGYWAAPLHQQVFDWFRTKRIDSTVGLTLDNTGYTYMITNNAKIEAFDHKHWPDETYATYEEARDACIIKLIEILKSEKA